MRRYCDDEKARAVRLVCQSRDELGMKEGMMKRVAEQDGDGVESVRAWVRQADLDGGIRPGTTTRGAEELQVLRQEVKELRRANTILKSASAWSGRIGVMQAFRGVRRLCFVDCIVL